MDPGFAPKGDSDDSESPFRLGIHTMDGRDLSTVRSRKDSSNLTARYPKQDAIDQEESNVVPIESLESSKENGSVDPDKDSGAYTNSPEHWAKKQSDRHIVSPPFKAHERNHGAAFGEPFVFDEPLALRRPRLLGRPVVPGKLRLLGRPVVLGIPRLFGNPLPPREPRWLGRPSSTCITPFQVEASCLSAKLETVFLQELSDLTFVTRMNLFPKFSSELRIGLHFLQKLLNLILAKSDIRSIKNIFHCIAPPIEPRSIVIEDSSSV